MVPSPAYGWGHNISLYYWTDTQNLLDSGNTDGTMSSMNLSAHPRTSCEGSVGSDLPRHSYESGNPGWPHDLAGRLDPRLRRSDANSPEKRGVVLGQTPSGYHLSSTLAIWAFGGEAGGWLDWRVPAKRR